MPSAIVRALTRLMWLVDVAGERPGQHGRGQQPGVRARPGRPAQVTSMRSKPPPLSPARQPPQLRGQRQERAQHLHVLGACQRDVDGVRDETAGQRGHHLLGHDQPGPVLGLLGGGAQMRRHDHVGQLEDAPLGVRARTGTRPARRRPPGRPSAPRRASSSSISPPRAAFTIRTPGRISAIVSAQHQAGASPRSAARAG